MTLASAPPPPAVLPVTTDSHPEGGLLALLAVASAATFIVTTTGSSLAPFLRAIGADFQRDLGSVATLLALQAVFWGLASLFAGAASDRIGRRPIIVGAVGMLALARFGFSQSGGYTEAVVWQCATGACGGAFMGTMFAAVADRVPIERRGSALSWVMTGQSMSLLLGAPLMAYIGNFGGWRGAVATHGVMAILMAALLWWRIRPGGATRTPGRAGGGVPWARLLQPHLLLLLGAGATERLCFAATTVYLATYLQTSYGVSLTQLAGCLAVVALGNVIGSVVGGRIADRVSNRAATFAVASLVTGALALPLLAWPAGLWISVGLGFCYSFCNAIGRPALMTLLADVPDDMRGAVLGANVTTASIGWLGASAIGGWLIGSHGFASLALFCAAIGLCGTITAGVYLVVRARMTR